MLVPSIFGESLLDDFMDGFGFTNNVSRKQNTVSVMKTDIKETANGYELDIDLPGFKKEDVKAQLKDGYLTINATNTTSNDEKNSEGKYTRRERYTGSVSRSFYVGENVTQEDIHAKFENGILQLSIPKKEAKAIAQNNYIAIE